jgi:hypothetical protein
MFGPLFEPPTGAKIVVFSDPTGTEIVQMVLPHYKALEYSIANRQKQDQRTDYFFYRTKRSRSQVGNLLAA